MEQCDICKEKVIKCLQFLADMILKTGNFTDVVDEDRSKLWDIVYGDFSEFERKEEQ